ncbi:acyl-CoA dehydrogenase family protein [Streptomyces sp. NPDC058320]|uniref:acyl-CoA dehydrogenase family protein n=1 Tax=unclassified Streptomyces TaxID=2593676 RepID=UPI00362DF36A
MTPTDISVFRSRVRDFLDCEVPALLDGVMEFADRARTYRQALHDAGLAGLSIPREFGGQGLPQEYERAFAEESAETAPPEDKLFLLGLVTILPTLVSVGAADLARRFGAGILSGEYPACQLFSEPEAGSDLPGVRTRAVPDGEGGWVVTGQKVWTTFAHHARLGLLLARTDPDAPKHAGLSMFLIDMDALGVEVRPLRQMTGECEFNEVFLDGVRVPGDRLVGTAGDGWKTALTVLGHERLSVSRSGNTVARRPLPVTELVHQARRMGRTGDPAVRRDLLDAWMGERTATLITDRIGALARSGRAPGPETSLGKLHRTANGLRNARIAADLAFDGGAAWDSEDNELHALAREILDAPGLGFGGGTDEIQRNTIGERILGLPREPSVERGVPFSELLSVQRQEKP